MIDLLLFFVALLAGALNSVAGGGTFLAFPALIFAGVSPIAANATCTIAVWPGALASTAAYRGKLASELRSYIPMLAVSLLGGAAGSITLLLTPSSTFEFLIPWLMLLASALFSFSPQLKRYSRSGATPTAALGVLQFVIAFYGGYFGAGIGILMLALLALKGMTEIHQMNALKTLLGTAINGVAVLIFALSGQVEWRYAAVMALGGILGGYLGAHYAQKLPGQWVRGFVMLVAWGMTAWFFMGR